jgi:glycosyltransferase involved in cell wall biosynthesis
VLVVLDNFRVGGIERLALDQLFALSDMGISAVAYYRQEKATRDNPNFLELEEERIAQKGIQINAMPEGDLAQLRVLVQFLRNNRVSIVINHSIGASVILRLAKIFSRNRVTVKTFIHQLPTLSAPMQRLKRFLYALTSDELFGYSAAVVQDWNKRLNRNLLSRKLLGWKRPSILRNGIYLNRLPGLQMPKEEKPKQVRMVFIGRGVAWKNIDFIITSLRSLAKNQVRALLVLPSIDPEARETLTAEFGNRIDFEIGKKIEDIVFTREDVNVYPVNYGPEAEFIESISLNCLEMACIGIPSLLTKGGCTTWPELLNQKIFYEVDWTRKEDFYSILNLAINSHLEINQINYAKRLISITNNVAKILRIEDENLKFAK